MLQSRRFVVGGLDLTDPALYAAPPKPARDALPATPTDSPMFALLEDAAVWTAGWVCVGTRHAIPTVGDLLPFTVGNQGIHVEHRPDGSLAGRFNVAPHGGCRVVPLQCQTGRKTSCSFTSCGHSRDRRALHVDDQVASHQYLGLRPERLVPVPVATAGPLVLVNLGEVAPIPAGERLRHLALETAPCAPESWHEHALNWKDLLCRLLDGEVADVGDPWLVARGRLADGPAELRWLFPNLLLMLRPRSACVVVVQPTAVAQTLLRVTRFGEDDPWIDGIEARLRTGTAQAPAAAFLRDALGRRVARFRTLSEDIRQHA